jgi:small GTP-binding protein
VNLIFAEFSLGRRRWAVVRESHTIGVEFGSKVVEVAGKRVKAQIWDTAGQERFRSVTKSYYRSSAGAILVYDITNRDSFLHATTWLTDARALTSPDTVFLLVGNKTDLADSARQVTFLEASRFAQENRSSPVRGSAGRVVAAFRDPPPEALWRWRSQR